MNNLIEQYLDEFFKELQHTPGPWKVITTKDVKINRTGNEYTAMAIWGECTDIMYFHGKEEPNSKLIARAPDMLRTICRTYLTLLVKFPFNDRQNSTVREIRITLDGTLSSLRNEISNATGLECQYIQDTFEDYTISINEGN